MQVKHHWYLMVATMVLAFTGVFSIATTTQAATWHAGTPTALRGVWRTKTAHSMRYYIHVGKSTYNDEQVYDTKTHSYITDPFRLTQVVYHHKSGSHYYYIKGAHNTEPGTKKVYYVVHKVGNKLKEREYGQSVKGHYTKISVKYGPWHYKA